MSLTPGMITQQILDKKRVKSPCIDGKIEIARGFWVVPKSPPANVKEFIEQKRKKFGIL